MKIALIGLSNSGKTTAFNALTGLSLETTSYPTVSGEPHRGTVRVPDQRLEEISAVFKPKKTTHATVEYLDYIGITKGDIEQNKKVFELIKDTDAGVHIVRAFHDDAVAHPLGNIDPLRDAELIELELILGDIEFVEKRLARMDEGAKRGKKPDESEMRLLLRCRDSLQKEIPLRNVPFTHEELDAMKHLQFLSTKPEIIVLNAGERDLGGDWVQGLESTITARYPKLPLISLCGKIEMEIAQLSPEDARLFLADLGLEETASNRLIRVCYDTLGLISFFTYAGNEVRSWTVPKDTNAQKAAGKVHSDMERGFIRAEVVSYDDFISAGNLQSAREKGILRLEGKTYKVRDGDIINFRFNV
ncbi:MAG: redox-regulated ATPase YchF [Nitrospirota bacterium]